MTNFRFPQPLRQVFGLMALLVSLLPMHAQNNQSWQAQGYVLAAPLRDMALAGNRLFACSPEGIFVSSNYGSTWTRTYSGQWEQHNAAAAIGNTVFVTSENGLLRSSDGGATWTLVPGSYGDYGFYRRLLALNTRLFRNGLSINGSSTVWEYSDNQGQTWAALPNVTDLYVSNGVLLALNASGSVLRSTSLGAAWTQLAPALGQPVAALAIINQRVYAAAGGQIFTYQNGNGWNLRSNGLSGAPIVYLAAFGSQLYASTPSETFFQAYNSSTWQPNNVSAGLRKVIVAGTRRMFLWADGFGNNTFPSTNPYNRGMGNSIVPHLAVAQLNVGGSPAEHVIAANHNFYDEDMGAGMYVFSAYSRGSSPYNGQSNSTGVYTQALFADGDDVFSYTYVPGAGCCGTLTRTLDGGQTVDYLWTSYGLDPNPYALARIGTTLFAGVDGGVAIATHQGDSIRFQPDFWTPNTGLNAGEAVTFLLASGSSLLAGTSQGLYLSQDMAQTFTSLGLQAQIYDVQVLGSGQVLAATASGVFRAASLGSAVWTPAGSGLPAAPVYALQSYGSSVYAATGSGVYVSGNAGTSWSPFNSGLSNLDVRALAMNGAYLVAGTNGQGIFTRFLEPSSSNAASVPFSLEPASDAAQLTLKVYPNPASGQFVAELPAAGLLTLTALDGRVVLEQEAAGAEAALSLQDYLPGFYVLTLRTATGSYAARIELR